MEKQLKKTDYEQPKQALKQLSIFQVNYYELVILFVSKFDDPCQLAQLVPAEVVALVGVAVVALVVVAALVAVAFVNFAYDVQDEFVVEVAVDFVVEDGVNELFEALAVVTALEESFLLLVGVQLLELEPGLELESGLGLEPEPELELEPGLEHLHCYFLNKKLSQLKLN